MDLGEFITTLAGTGSDYWITRFVFQRALGLTYLLAFLAVINQFKPLLGERGLLPVPRYVKATSFWESPSIFHFAPNDGAFTALGYLGLALAVLATAGVSERFGTGISAAIWALMWVIYLSFVNVGQVFYAFGWESILLETGFTAIFLGANDTTPSVLTIFLLRWILFRVMFGAGLIKLRGDPCWKKLTCLFYHYETQPIPNPLSWAFHHAPRWFHRLGVLYNHFVELVVPFVYFFMQPLAAIAGILTLIFHGILFVSGNYAFLGFLTMVLAISAFHDSLLARIIPITPPETFPISPLHQYAIWAFTALVAVLSVPVIFNLFSPRQAMNLKFNPFHLVNTYGAFGGVTKKRYEVVVEATMDEQIGGNTEWKAYEFKAKPTDVRRIPPQVAPYHLRLDWLMWFEGIHAGAAYERGGVYFPSRWFIHLLVKFLKADRDTLQLIKHAPFGTEKPRFVRALLYHYRFTSPKERAETGAIWKRDLKDIYIPPTTLKIHHPGAMQPAGAGSSGLT